MYQKENRIRILINSVIIKSDYESQYVLKNYRDTLGVRFIRSYTRKSAPRDNAYIESLHASIKREWLKSII